MMPISLYNYTSCNSTWTCLIIRFGMYNFQVPVYSDICMSATKMYISILRRLSLVFSFLGGIQPLNKRGRPKVFSFINLVSVHVYLVSTHYKVILKYRRKKISRVLSTDHGRTINPFFIEIPNFWAWVGNSGGISGRFRLSTLSMFSSNQSLFLQKTKPLYPNPQYLF